MTKDIAEYFDENAERYSESQKIEIMQKKLSEKAACLASWPKGSKILDVGCGPGFSIDVLQKRGYDVVGIDISPKMIRIAKDKGFNVVQSDATKMPFDDESFDGLVSISLLQWLGNKELKKVARECHRVLKEGATAIIQFYPKEDEDILRITSKFVKRGFDGEIYMEDPKSPRKSGVFLILKRVERVEEEPQP